MHHRAARFGGERRGEAEPRGASGRAARRWGSAVADALPRLPQARPILCFLALAPVLGADEALASLASLRSGTARAAHRSHAARARYEKIQCKTTSGSGKLEGGSPGKVRLESEKYTECAGAPCEVVNKATTQDPNIKGEPVRETSTERKALVKFVGAGAGQLYVKIKLEGLFCSAKAPVAGEVLGRLLPAAAEVAKGELVCPDPALTKYWTTDTASGGGKCVAPTTREEHNIKQIAYNAKAATYHAEEEVELVSKEVVGVFQAPRPVRYDLVQTGGRGMPRPAPAPRTVCRRRTVR